MQIEHDKMVAALVKPGKDIINSLTPAGAHALHMAVGISGEAGELLDAIKKHTIYRKELDRDNVIEELGDLLFYMEGLCQGVGTTLEECKEENIKKLSKRYPNGFYTDQAAQERADKNSA